MPKSAQAQIDLPPPGQEASRLSDRSLAYLRTLLLEGGLDPGQAVPIDQVAAVLGVSRQPVKQAVSRLAEEGFLQIRPQAGSWVERPTPAGARDFYALFAPAEACIAQFAAERRTEAEAKTFRATALAIEHEAEAIGGPGGADPHYRRLNRRFHDALHAMARSPAVARTVAAMWDRSDFLIRVAFGSLFFDRATRAAHKEIAAAISAGDGAAAHAATAAHIARVGARVADRLGEL